MSAAQVREAMERYVGSEHSDLSMMADDVVLTMMATGEEHHGPDGVAAMLREIYHVAFDGRAERRTLICGETSAMLEATFVGRHIGEFAGVPATRREVRVPFCVVYDFAGGRIRRGRVYFEVPVLMQQLSAAAGMALR